MCINLLLTLESAYDIMFTEAAEVLLKDLLLQYDLQQLVDFETHKSGHTIDLVITRQSDTLVQSVSVSEYVSDHRGINCLLNLQKPEYTKRLLNYRKLKSIDLDKFADDVIASPLISNPVTTTHDLTDQYNAVLSQLVNVHAPMQTRHIIDRPAVPWCNQRFIEQKRRRRQLERKWLKSRLTVDHDIFKTQRDLCKRFLTVAKTLYYNEKIKGCGGNQKELFKITNHLTHRKHISNLPTDLPAHAFSAYFIGKIDQIRDDLASNRADPAPPSLSSSRPSPNPTLTTLNPVSEQEIAKIIQSSSPKSCQLDPLPTVMVKNLKTTLAVPITRLINMSLATGEIPDSFKTALITPVLKNESLDSTEKKNYRPISNLPFVSKVAEKVAAARLNSHLEEGKLLESQQSAYKKFHSVETALLKVHNDIMCAVDSKRAAMRQSSSYTHSSHPDLTFVTAFLPVFLRQYMTLGL
ncbi:uncharacterized protein LOC117302571 [Asterias rubens]|uniref:uncharacterized protein LOC117302571 n=1 Tax=Asterias rubens TaxID=7604 RepID=UPI001455132A|nr:uncharacterized protein LOC117302571 [Asterias rubens]